MKVDVQIVNAFVFKGSGGNPAGVVLDVDRFSTEEKLGIAAKVLKGQWYDQKKIDSMLMEVESAFK